MNENLHDIDKLFKSAIDQHEDNPSPGVWDSIDNKLDKSKVVDINKKYNQLKRVAILLLLLLSGVVFYEYNKNRNNRDVVKNNPADKTGVKESTAKKSSPPFDSDTNAVSNNSKPPTPDKLEKQDNNNVISQNEKDRNNSKKSYQHFKKSDSRASEYSGNDLFDKNKSDKNKSDKNKSIEPGSTINFVKNRLVNRKGIMKIKIDNPGQSQVPDEDNAKIVQQDIVPYKYHDNIELIPSDINNFHKLLKAPISNITADRLALSKKYDQPVDKRSKDIVKKERGNTKKILISNFSINPFFSPDFAFYSLKNDQPHGRGDDRHDIKKDEKHQFSYTTGFLADYALNSHFSVQSGVAFTKTTINTVSKNIYAERDNSGSVRYRINGSCGYAYISPYNNSPAIGDSIKAVNSKNELEYIQVPLAIKYNLPVGKFIFSASTGVALNFLTKGALNTVVDNGVTKVEQVVNKVEGLKKSYLNGLIGFGTQYNVNQKIALTFTPTVKLAFTAINSGAAVKTYPSSLGISGGVRIKL